MRHTKQSLDRYVVICRYGADDIMREKAAIMDRRRVVHDIARGQFEDVSEVHWYCIEDGICQDISEDIAREVLAYCLDEDGTLEGKECVNFIEHQLGCEAVANELREYAA